MSQNNSPASNYRVVLEALGPNKIKVIKHISMSGKLLTEAKELAENTPSVIYDGDSREIALSLVTDLEAVGAGVSLQEQAADADSEEADFEEMLFADNVEQAQEKAAEADFEKLIFDNAKAEIEKESVQKATDQAVTERLQQLLDHTKLKAEKENAAQDKQLDFVPAVVKNETYLRHLPIAQHDDQTKLLPNSELNVFARDYYGKWLNVVNVNSGKHGWVKCDDVTDQDGNPFNPTQLSFDKAFTKDSPSAIKETADLKKAEMQSQPLNPNYPVWLRIAGVYWGIVLMWLTVVIILVTPASDNATPLAFIVLAISSFGGFRLASYYRKQLNKNTEPMWLKRVAQVGMYGFLLSSPLGWFIAAQWLTERPGSPIAAEVKSLNTLYKTRTATVKRPMTAAEKQSRNQSIMKWATIAGAVLIALVGAGAAISKAQEQQKSSAKRYVPPARSKRPVAKKSGAAAATLAAQQAAQRKAAQAQQAAHQKAIQENIYQRSQERYEAQKQHRKQSIDDAYAAQQMQRERPDWDL